MTPLKLISYFVVFLLVLLSAQAQQRSQPQSLLPTSNSSPANQSRSLRQHAVRALAKLVPDLKIPLINSVSAIPPTDDQIRAWYNWIASHREQLGRLQPTERGDVNPSDCARLEKVNFEAQDVPSVHITTTWSGSGPSRTGDYTISNRSGKFYMGKRLVNQSALIAFFNAIREPQEQSPSLTDLGLTASWLAANAKEALEEASTRTVNDTQGHPQGLDERDKKKFLEMFTDVKAMNDLLPACFRDYDPLQSGDLPWVKVEIRLRDGRAITLRSQRNGLFLLPWKIDGQEHRKLFDQRISLALAAFLPKDAPNADRLAASGQYAIRRQLAFELEDQIKGPCFTKECTNAIDSRAAEPVR